VGYHSVCMGALLFWSSYALFVSLVRANGEGYLKTQIRTENTIAGKIGGLARDLVGLNSGILDTRNKECELGNQHARLELKLKGIENKLTNVDAKFKVHIMDIKRASAQAEALVAEVDLYIQRLTTQGNYTDNVRTDLQKIIYELQNAELQIKDLITDNNLNKTQSVLGSELSFPEQKQFKCLREGISIAKRRAIEFMNKVWPVRVNPT
jgi:hypothetical protein